MDRRRYIWLPATFLALTAALVAGPGSSIAEEPKDPGGPPPGKVSLRLRLEEAGAFDLKVAETLRAYSYPPGKEEEQVADVEVWREGRLSVVSTKEGGGGVVRLTYSRVHGKAWDRIQAQPQSSRFDSSDPEWNASQCDRWVAFHMNDVGRSVDLDLSARGEILGAARPADGSTPFVMFTLAKTDEDASGYLAPDLQRFFPGLPEDPVGAASHWTRSQGRWLPPSAGDLGPLSMKCTVLGKPGELVTVIVKDAEKKKDRKEEERIKGKILFSSGTGMLHRSSLSISVVRRVAVTSDGPIFNRLRYSIEAEVTPAKEK